MSWTPLPSTHLHQTHQCPMPWKGAGQELGGYDDRCRSNKTSPNQPASLAPAVQDLTAVHAALAMLMVVCRS